MRLTEGNGEALMKKRLKPVVDFSVEQHNDDDYDTELEGIGC